MLVAKSGEPHLDSITEHVFEFIVDTIVGGIV